MGKITVHFHDNTIKDYLNSTEPYTIDNHVYFYHIEDIENNDNEVYSIKVIIPLNNIKEINFIKKTKEIKRKGV